METIDDNGEIISTPFLRTPYNYNRKAASQACALCCNLPTRTNQSDAEETDINVIVARFGITGQLPQGLKPPMHGDFSEAPTYQEALNQIRRAEETFMELPSDIRERFRNDPGAMVDFIGKEENRKEAEAMGMVIPKKAPAGPISVRVIAEPEEGKKP